MSSLSRHLADAIESIPINWSNIEQITRELRQQHRKTLLWLVCTLIAAVCSAIFLPAFVVLALVAYLAARSSRKAIKLDIALARGRQAFFADIRTLSSWIEHGDLTPLVRQEVIGVCNHYEKLFQELES